MASEPQTQPLAQDDERSVMHKRVEQKEDGRTLIYYTFGDAQKESIGAQKTNESSGAEKK